MGLVILIPALTRAHLIAPLMASIRETTPHARVLFLTTPDDDQVIAEIERSRLMHLSIPWDRGDYPRKINQGIAATTEEHIFTGATDILFRPGWYEAACAKLADGIGVVGTNDLTNPAVMAGEHATHMLVTRTYVQRFGTIDEPGKFFHEGYWHEFCDAEAVETAKRRGAWAFAADSVVEHMHPLGGKAPMDKMYASGEVRTQFGRRTFEGRRALWQ